MPAALVKRMLIFCTVFCVLIVSSVNARAQSVLSGKVLSKVDGTPIAGVSVFLSNTTLGTKTDDKGIFGIRNVKPGKYEVALSIIGYEVYHQTVTVGNTDVSLPNILLLPKITELNTVTVTFKKDPNRERNYEWFKEEFLGKSALANDCKILNPDVLDLDYDINTYKLTASSTDFLEIENKALGYKIKYLLTSFTRESSADVTQKMSYEGIALFTEMAGTDKERRNWQKKRQQVFEGSAMHFLRSLARGSTAQEGFKIVQVPVDKKSQIQKPLMFALNQSDVLTPTDQAGLHALNCDGDALHVTYNKRGKYYNEAHINNLNALSNTDETVLSFVGPHVIFDNNGIIVNPSSIQYYGAMSRNRIAEMLPVNFEPAAQQTVIVNDIKPDAFISTPNSGDPAQQALLKIKAQSDSLNKNFAAEKIHMQFDKPYYALGDTIWFKAWLINAPSLLLSAKSGLLHVEIATDSNKIVQQFLLPVNNGVTWGNIAINDKDYKAGTYIIRAYTNWMRNFSDELFYYKRINITTTYEDAWLVNSKVRQSVVNAKPNVQAVLQFKNLDNTAVVGKSVNLRVMSGKKTLFKQTLDTDLFGSMDINFAPPQKTSDLYIIAESSTKDKRSIIPLNLNNPANIDLQFMPEGGSLIAGLPALIGFKAINEDGHGADVKGIVTDSKGQQVATFASTHKGMGSFMLDGIKAGELYSAKVHLANGQTKTYLLPVVKATGLSLRIDNSLTSDSLKLTIAAGDELLKRKETYFLLAKARGVVCYAAVLNFKDKRAITRVLTKNLFPTGITHFILTTELGNALNERMVFVDHRDQLDIKLKMPVAGIATKDSVQMELTVTDNTRKPVLGNFALSVTDDALVNIDTLQGDNVFTNLLLSSELKGHVEQPGYYFRNTAETWRALDNLLLTQGWVNYDIAEKGVTYQAETNYSVSGKVINLFNKPVSGSKMLMFSNRPLTMQDTITNKNGLFTFKLPIVDTPAFILKAVNKSGKSFNVSIDVKEVKPPVFENISFINETPWYVNAGDTLTNYVKNNIALKRENEKIPVGTRLLKQVTITAKKIVKESQNLNGAGNADFVMDEKDVEKEGKKTLFELFQSRIPGFRLGYFDYPRKGHHPGYIDPNAKVSSQWYYVHDKAIILIVDGVDPRLVMNDQYFKYEDFRDFLRLYSAEDIKGLEVNSSSKYNFSYLSRFMPGFEIDLTRQDFAFVEITTRGGSGPLISNPIGTYLYKPLALSLPKQFYKPKYNVNDVAKTVESRSTINWEPNIITDANGHATVKFNSAGKPSTYTIITQGVDYNGNIGYKYQKISVGKTTSSLK